MGRKQPTFVDVLRDLAAAYDQPVDERELCARVLDRRPSRARDPLAAVRSTLRASGSRHGWLRLGDGTAVPLHVVLQDLRFRVVPCAAEVDAGVLCAESLEPFVGTRAALTGCDPQGRPLVLPGLPLPESLHAEGCGSWGYDLRAWYRYYGFQPGDSVLITMSDARDGVLMLEYEPLAAFRSSECAARDQELAEALYRRLSASRDAALPCDAAILTTFYAAPWRTGYPGSPWRKVVAAEPRLTLIDGCLIGLRGVVGLLLDQTLWPEGEWEEAEARLLADIDALQQELRRSRASDSTNGIWSGVHSRASAERVDDDDDDEDDDLPASLEALEAIYDHDDFFDPPADMLFADDLTFDAHRMDLPLPGGSGGLRDATRQLFAVLTEAELRQLQSANAADAELFLASKLNELLVRAPALFVPLEPGAALALDEPSDVGVVGMEWIADDDDDDDEWIDDDWDSETMVDALIARSFELISSFHDSILESGRSKQTAAARADDVWIYADFLARYYNRSLDQGDYATLDECLFFYLPRKIVRSSPRMARDLCTSLKQFYSFLRQHTLIADDSFAHALWRRRHQAARVIDLYDGISSDSPNFELLFRRLFTPYV